MKDLASMDYFKHYKGMNHINENAVFFKKGIAGNWVKYFSGELSTKFDQVIEEKLKAKIQFDYGQ